MLNLPLLWVSALFYIALVSALYVMVGGLAWLIARFIPLTEAARKRVLLTSLVVPPFLALLPTIAGATLRHLHGQTMPMSETPYSSFHPEPVAPLAHHAASCQQLFNRLALLGGLGASGEAGQGISVAVGAVAWLLVVSGLVLAFRLIGATLRLERGIVPLITPPSPRLRVALARAEASLPGLGTARFFECAIPAALSSVLGLRQARCVLSARFVADVPDAELDAVIAHEAHHLRSGDVQAAFAVGMLNSLFFFLRPVRALSRAWREATELACDDAAVHRTRDPLAMASAILHVSGVNTATPRLPATALPFADDQTCSPAKRVERLLNQAEQAAAGGGIESPALIALGWAATGILTFVGVGLLLSSEAACVAHCALELVHRLL